MRMLAANPCWCDHQVVKRLAKEVLLWSEGGDDLPEEALRLSDEHTVPAELMTAVRALLGT
jgi:hypothetical protein